MTRSTKGPTPPGPSSRSSRPNSTTIHEIFLASNPTHLRRSATARCSRAAGTDAALGDLTRYLTYHEHHGDRAEARRLYAEMADSARDWKGADLAAAQEACPSHLNFSELLPKVDEYLA